MDRRKFIKNTSLLIAGSSLAASCSTTPEGKIKGGIVGANAKTGHLLRTTKWEDSTERLSTEVLIIGGGVSGLSAGRTLWNKGMKDFMLLELDNETGGNAASGSNDVSGYPWGAHYVPIPNNDLPEYLSFLEENGVITGYDEKGLPVINEYYLCFEPQERLYIKGYWQEGLIPDFSVPAADAKQLKDFLAAMNVFRMAKGADEKFAFTIPAEKSSSDEIYRRLDTISMKQWLTDNGFTSPYLNWYVNYCCRDDFGTASSVTSAWAGINYFASRKGLAANAAPQSVITWPEGNGWLIKKIKKDIGANIRTNHLAAKLRITATGVEACVVDVKNNKTKIISAKKCILAVPQFVAAYLLDYDEEKKKIVKDNFSYQPWMVANITVDGLLKEKTGRELSWDNVFYDSPSLGYVEATHQRTQQDQTKKVLTYYYPLTAGTAASERQAAYSKTYEDWKRIILKDLSAIHDGIGERIKSIDVWVWGHGMISPHVGFIHGTARHKMSEPVNDTLFFAHTDLSGISIFEEGFYQGLNAAQNLLKNLPPA